MPRAPLNSSENTGTEPSKSELKRRMHELQALGEALAALPDDRLAAAEMPAALREAFAELKRTRSHEGRRRQMQFIGKLMRRCDAEPLRQAVADFELGSAGDALLLHQAEAWRDQLIADDAALARWALKFPQSDWARLSPLLRAARADAAQGAGERHGRAYRELFKFIKPWLTHDEH
jgi:ribosome-associated protein